MARFFSILNALLHIVTANKFRYNTFIHCFYCWNKCGVAYNSPYMVLCSYLEWKVGLDNEDFDMLWGEDFLLAMWRCGCKKK